MLRWFFCLDHVSMSNKCCLLLVFYYLWSLVVGDNLKIESPPVWKKCFFPYWTWWLSIVPQRHIWQFSFCLCLVFRLYCGYIGFQNGRDQSDENIVNRTCHNCHMSWMCTTNLFFIVKISPPIKEMERMLLEWFILQVTHTGGEY